MFHSARHQRQAPDLCQHAAHDPPDACIQVATPASIPAGTCCMLTPALRRPTCAPMAAVAARSQIVDMAGSPPMGRCPPGMHGVWAALTRACCCPTSAGRGGLDCNRHDRSAAGAHPAGQRRPCHVPAGAARCVSTQPGDGTVGWHIILLLILFTA